jgi:SAM-dependent methyltransferase
MSNAQDAASDQAAWWNGPSGLAWVEAQAVVDQLFAGLEQRLVEAVEAAGKRQVLDVGCGTGGTTLAIARRLGAGGRCVGVDISEPMIAAARARVASEGVAASFVRADVQGHDFAAASFDMIVSRFGVMFFDDPVRAFANLRRAATPDAALCCIAWRGPEENPFMTTAERAAAPLLPNLPSRMPDAPGQFGFADGARIRRILEESGWAGIDIQPVDFPCTMPEAALTGYFTRFGPLSQLLARADAATQRQVVEVVRAAFAAFVEGAEVRFTAACWMVGARKLS